MRIAPARHTPVLETVSLERFDYCRVGSTWALVRLLARLCDELEHPAEAALVMSRIDAPGAPNPAPALSFPARARRVEHRLSANGQQGTLLWQGAFALPTALLHDERFAFALQVDGHPSLQLPAPVLHETISRTLPLSSPHRGAVRPAPAHLRRRAAALATAAAITTTSTPAAAIAASVHGSTTGVGQTGGPVHSGLDPQGIATAGTTTSTATSPTSASVTPVTVTAGPAPATSTAAPTTVTAPTATPPATPPVATTPTTTPPVATPTTPTTTTTTTPVATPTTPTTTTTTTPVATTPTTATPVATPTTPTAPSTTTADTPQPIVKADPGRSRTGDTTGATVTRLSSSSARPAAGDATTTTTTTTATTSTPPESAGPARWGQDAFNGSTAASAHPDRAIAHPTAPSRHSATGAGRSGASPTTTTSTVPGTVPELSSSAPGFLGPQSWTGTVTTDPEITGAVRNLSGLLSDESRPPSFLIPIYMQAAKRYHVPWEVLAAINSVETDYGRDINTSSAGAIGWMQFEPATWKEYGVAVDGHSVANPYDPRDAIFAAARYLRAAGGSRDIARAIYAYNHAGWYVDEVMTRARKIAANAQFERATTGRKGEVSVYFATDRTVTTRSGKRKPVRVRYRGGVMSHLDRLIAAANMVSAADFPYLWGGGHEQPARFGPFDCSGAVSYVMQQAGYKVPTTVAGDVGSAWKFPTGPGKVTIFYNSVHTFMRIGGRFFGTSGFARPGGGAGWFEVDKLPVNYLAGFNEVHVPRLGTDSFARNSGLAKRAQHRFETRASRMLEAARRVERLGEVGPNVVGGIR